MSTQVRKFTLVTHITSSVGWMGAVAAFIALDVATVVSQQTATLRAAYIAMDLIARLAIVPLAFASFVTGIAISLGTKWGLFRHYWVVITLVLTVLATLVLLLQMPLIAYRAEAATDPLTSEGELQGLGNLLLHSVGGTAVLLLITALNVYKPHGVTKHGLRTMAK